MQGTGSDDDEARSAVTAGTATVTRGTAEHGGCTLSYTLRGSGPPVLFIQGIALHGDGWLPQVEPLSRVVACLTFDNRGVGASQPAAGALTVPAMAEDARAVMDAAGWRSAHVVGHSLGGLIALELALSAPDRVSSLALLCTFARGRDAGATARMMWLGLRSRVGTRRMRRRAFLEIVLPPASLAGADRDRLAADLAPIFGHDLAEHSRIEMAQLAAMRAYDATPRLTSIAGIPALVVSAAHDPIAPPRLGRALAAALPKARYIEIADASHGVPIEQAARINRFLTDFLADV